MIHDLESVVRREEAAMGVLVSIQPRQAESLKTDARTRDLPGLFDALQEGAGPPE